MVASVADRARQSGLWSGDEESVGSGGDLNASGGKEEGHPSAAEDANGSSGGGAGE